MDDVTKSANWLRWLYEKSSSKFTSVLFVQFMFLVSPLGLYKVFLENTTMVTMVNTPGKLSKDKITANRLQFICMMINYRPATWIKMIW